MNENEYIDPETEFNQAVKWVLRELDKERRATPDGESIYYKYQSGGDAPIQEDQRRALKFLNNKEAIKLLRKEYPLGAGSFLGEMYPGLQPLGYHLSIVQPRFGEMVRQRLGEKKTTHLYAERGVLYLAGKTIQISKGNKETYPLQFIKTILKEPEREWFKDEVLKDWGYSDQEQEGLPKLRVYNAAKSVNDLVAKAAQIGDFILHTTEKFQINPKYLNNT